MKITKTRLKEIIVEELQTVMNEFSMADLDVVNKMELPSGKIIEVPDEMRVEDNLDDLNIQYIIKGDTAVISMIPPESMESFKMLF